MDLGLDVRRLTGRAAKPVEYEVLGPVTPADIARMNAQEGTLTTKPPPIRRLRDTHHALARLLANGTSGVEASAITGYTPSRISILKADPQFRELVEFYRLQGTEAVADFRKRMTLMGMDALEELRERLEQNPDEMSSAMLLEITKVMADRTGHAPAAKSATAVQVNVNLAERMDRARERVERLRNGASDD